MTCKRLEPHDPHDDCPGINGFGTSHTTFMRAPWRISIPTFQFGLDRVDPSLDGTIIELITPKELDTLPAGTELVSINGTRAIIGRDAIDRDTRGGMLAFGIIREDQRNEDLGAYALDKGN